MNSLRGVLSTGEMPDSSPPREPTVLHYKPEYDTYTVVLQIILSLVVFLASSLYCLYTFHRKREQPREREDKSTATDGGTLDPETDEKDPRDGEVNPKAAGDNEFKPAINNETDETGKTDEKQWQKYDELINSEDMPWQMIDIKVPAGSKYPKHLFEAEGSLDSSEEDAEIGDNTEAREKKTDRDENAKDNIVQQSVPTEIGPTVMINPVGHLERKRSSASLHSDGSSKVSARKPSPSPQRGNSKSRPTSGNRKPFVVYCGANQHSNTSLRRMSPVAASRRVPLPPNQSAAPAVPDKNPPKNVRNKSPEKSATGSNK